MTYEHVYDGLDDMVAAADAGVAAGRRWAGLADLGGRSSFIGRQFTTWSDVKAKLGEGWPEGLDEVQWMLFELRKAALPPITCQKRRPRFADGGDEVDLDRLRAGQECWRTLKSRVGCRPTDVLRGRRHGHAGKQASMDILWRGAVAIVLADLLEAQGHRVEVWAACRQLRAFRDGAGSFQAACLKRADQPVDIATLTNAVSGWCYRTLFFQDRAAEPRARVSSAMGYPLPISTADPSVEALVGTARLVTVANVWSKADAVAFAARVIETLDQ
jgi:hypothetical protein